jgi:hypothetical protein
MLKRGLGDVEGEDGMLQKRVYKSIVSRTRETVPGVLKGAIRIDSLVYERLHSASCNKSYDQPCYLDLVQIIF